MKIISRCPIPYEPVSVDPPVICNGGTAILTSKGGGSYRWSTQDTTSVIHVSPATDKEYFVMVNSRSSVDNTSGFERPDICA